MKDRQKIGWRTDNFCGYWNFGHNFVVIEIFGHNFNNHKNCLSFNLFIVCPSPFFAIFCLSFTLFCYFLSVLHPFLHIFRFIIFFCCRCSIVVVVNFSGLLFYHNVSQKSMAATTQNASQKSMSTTTENALSANIHYDNNWNGTRGFKKFIIESFII